MSTLLPPPLPVAAPPTRLRSISSLILVVLVNLVPLIGIFALDWSVWTVLLLYWIENALTGFITFLRMLISAPTNKPMWAAKLFMLPFFTVHYGLFCAVHLIFLVVLFAPKGTSMGYGSPWDQITTVPQLLAAQPGMQLAMVVLGAVLLLRMLIDYVFSGAYRNARPEVEMFKPYSRIIVLHLTIIVSGVLVMAIGQPLIAVLVLVALKLAVELGYWRVGESDIAGKTQDQTTLIA